MKKTSVLPVGMTLTGDIEGDEDLVVLGRVEGAIQLDAALVIESGGAVRGAVRARTVTVRGVLVGDAHAEETIWVEDGARLVGDLVGPRVKVMDGARFRGHVRVLSPERPGPVVVPPPAPPRARPAAVEERRPEGRASAAPTHEREGRASAAPTHEREGRASATPTHEREGRAEATSPSESRERAHAASAPVPVTGRARRTPAVAKVPPAPTMPALGRAQARRRLAARD
jgi:cytoskeletal protein CcmA (bactofilin family)